MKIGILSFAHFHAETYAALLAEMNGVELVGLSDDDVERGVAAARQHKTTFYADYRDLIHSGLDAVLICSENVRHREHAEAAAAAGLHILCEKPLATNLADSKAIVAVCRQADVKLMTAFPMRFSPQLVQLKTQIDAGDFGTIRCLNGVNQGQLPKQYRTWFVDEELAGGGALMDHVVHLADIYNWLFGDDIRAVYAQANHILAADDVAVESGGLVMITYADGLFATIDCSWSKPGNYPTWGGLKIEMISDRGLTIVDGFSQNLDIYQQRPDAHGWLPWGSDNNRAMLAEFVSAIREDREPAVTGEDGHFALQIVDAAYRSARENSVTSLG